MRLEEVLEVVRRISRVAREFGCEVYLFGSYAKGTAVPSSDIDILVVCKKLPKSVFDKAKILCEIEEKANIPLVSNIHSIIVEEKHAKQIIKYLGKTIKIEPQ